ncbi:MaoC/PaaZ C-terminal domain-containing protein [Streptomyces mangrovisoli]|uniref:MaoC/PaaZ C-terminal domain-containing protein n=1 Tax=Streptomyces mangrovisoli TaxID=1428628 RepID=UPI0009A11507
MKAGERLAPLEIEITRTLVVSGAIASRDYQDVHHDPDLARRKGAPDVFMNILTTNGLVGRYVTDHFGPTAVLRRVAIRLGAPNYPGDTMVLTGTVEEVDGDTATVRITGANSLGRHVTGTVTVTVTVTVTATADHQEAPAGGPAGGPAGRPAGGPAGAPAGRPAGRPAGGPA